MIARLLISQSLDLRVEEIKKILSHFDLTPNHPDLLYLSDDSKLGIEQARIIKGHFSLKPYSAKGRAVVLENASNLTIEAQNALLKILEEPPPRAIIILGASSDAKLLPTVISRCEIIRLKNPTSHHTPTSEVGYEKEIEKLLESSIEQRFEYVEKLKDKEEFFYSLVGYFHQKLAEESTHSRPGLARLNQFLKQLLQAEEWQKQNVNLRAILEYLMLVMPQK